MIVLYRLLAGATLFLASLPALAQDTVVVRKVLTGTTVVLESGERVSLLGVGMPRTRVMEPEIIRDNLAGIVEGRTVILIDDRGATRRKRRGSRSAYLYYDGSLINLELIEDGFATATNTKHSRREEFRTAEKRARTQQVAAWSSEGHLSVQCAAYVRRGRRCTELTRHVSGRCEAHRRE